MLNYSVAELRIYNYATKISGGYVDVDFFKYNKEGVGWMTLNIGYNKRFYYCSVEVNK